MSNYIYSGKSYQQLVREEQRKKKQILNITIFLLRIMVVIALLISIVGSLFVAWLLKCFGFYTGVFVQFVQPLVEFQITTGFYYGAFVILGLICWVVTSIFSNNHS